MNGVIQSILLYIVIVEIIVGCFGNGFIALVNCIHWIKKRKISAVNQILTALAFSRISHLSTLLTFLFLSTLYSDLVLSTILVKLLNFHIIFSSHFSMWLAACLGLFYFLKIANFSNSIFVYLKMRVNQTVSGTLLMSLAFLFLNTLLINSYIDGQIGGHRRYLLYGFSSNDTAAFYRVILIINYSIFTFPPFVISQSTFLLLIFSLWRHHKRMQQYTERCRDALANAHIKVLKPMITYVLLCSIYFLVHLIQNLKTELLENIFYIRCCQIATLAFPSGHSCALIWGDTKLRQTSLFVLWWLMCRFKDVHPVGP